ncbi:MAG: hypothetical protein J5793_03265, partial [Clostridia bacterium]|nr:hypothetical protein [Clostridia bacterium]
MKRLGIRKLILIALDLVIAVFSLAVSTVISEHFTVNGLTPLIHGNFWAHAAMLFVIAFFARLIVFRYTTVWRYSTANDYIKFIATEIIVFAAYTLVDRFIFFENRIRIEGFHYSGVLVPLAAFAIDVVLILLSRFIYVAFFNSKHSGKHGENDG